MHILELKQWSQSMTIRPLTNLSEPFAGTNIRMGCCCPAFVSKQGGWNSGAPCCPSRILTRSRQKSLMAVCFEVSTKPIFHRPAFVIRCCGVCPRQSISFFLRRIDVWGVSGVVRVPDMEVGVFGGFLFGGRRRVLGRCHLVLDGCASY